MHNDKKFDPKKLAKLNDPKRLEYLDPDVIWAKVALSQPQVLIDIGAGTGFFAIHFTRKITKGKVFACDISEEMISWMNNNLPSELINIVVPVKMEENSIPLPNAISDLVYMINLHHELEEPLKLLAESYRLLKEGGKLMIIDWKKKKTPEGPPLEIRVNKETIASQMRKSRFSNVSNYAYLPYHYFLIGCKH